MGGDCFPNTRRLSEAEYGRVCGLVTLHLARLGTEARIPVEVSDKRQICEARGKTEPYGDVDVIVARRDDIPDMDIVLGVIDGTREVATKSSQTVQATTVLMVASNSAT